MHRTPTPRDHGRHRALETYGLKTAGVLGTAAKWMSRGLKWGGRALGVAPTGVGNAAGAVLGGVGGAVEGLNNGEGMKGMLLRGATGAASGALPLGAGMAVGMAGDAAANKILAPRTPGPATSPMTGALGSHLPGMVGNY